MTTMILGRRAALAATTLLATRPVRAQQADAYPSRPVRLVVPFPPGGSTDVVGRLVAQGLAESLGQPVVVENRAGAAGTIGSNAVRLSTPDGYTLVMSNIGSQGIAPFVYAAVPYDAVRDFTHVGMMGTFYNVMVVNPAFPARTLAEFLAEARRRPGTINFATSGNGSSNHLLGEFLKLEAGIDIVHVPYRGAGPALTATIAGEVPVMFDSIPSASPHIRAGTLRPLAVSAPARLPYLAEVPNFAEQGLPRLVATNWFGLSGPAALPAPVVARLAAALKAVITDQALGARLSDAGLDPTVMEPVSFTDFVAGQLAMWGDIVRRAGITAS